MVKGKRLKLNSKVVKSSSSMSSMSALRSGHRGDGHFQVTCQGSLTLTFADCRNMDHMSYMHSCLVVDIMF